MVAPALTRARIHLALPHHWHGVRLSGMRVSRLLFTCVAFLTSASAQIQIQPLLDLPGETRDPTLSPDGKTLAFDWCKPDYSCGIYTRPLGGGTVQLFAGNDSHDGSAHSPRWSPDGQTIAFERFYSRQEAHLVLRRVAGGMEKDFGAYCGGASTWSPDSCYVVAGRQLGVSVCRPTLYAASGQRIRDLAQRGEYPSLSPSGRFLAYTDGNSLKLLHLTADYRPAGPATTLAREPDSISDVSWAPDGKQIFYQTSDEGPPYLRRIAVQPGAKPQAIPGLNIQIAVTEFLTDRSALATETVPTEALWRADLHATPIKVDAAPDPGCSVPFPGCSPDARTGIIVKGSGSVLGIWLANADGTNERPLVKSLPGFLNPRDEGFPTLSIWSPDGKWIALTVARRHGGNADFSSNLYIVPSSGGLPRRLARNSYSIDQIIWSRDSKSLYGVQGWPIGDRTHTAMGALVRIDATDGTVKELAENTMWPALSVDGRFLYFFTNPYPKLHRIPVQGGMEETLLGLGNLQWFSYAVGSKYLYLFQMRPTTLHSNLIRFDPETKQWADLAEIPFQPRSAHLSSDQRFLYFQQQDSPKTRVVLVRGLY